MKKLFIFFVLTASIQAVAYQGIEECSDSRNEVHSIAHADFGGIWEYTYRGHQYNVLALDLLQKPADQLPVQFVAERVISLKCDGHKLVERTSMRTVILRDASLRQVVEAEVQCAGNFAMPPQTDLCP